MKIKKRENLFPKTLAVTFQDWSSYNSVVSLHKWLSYEVRRTPGCWVQTPGPPAAAYTPCRLVGVRHQPIGFEVCQSWQYYLRKGKNASQTHKKLCAVYEDEASKEWQ